LAFGKRTTEENGFKRFLKTVGDGADVTFCDRVFHSRDVATEKLSHQDLHVWKICA